MKKSDTLSSTVAILEQITAFDTTSRESNLQLIAHIQSYLDNLGIESRLTYNDDKSKANLWATIGPDIAGGVVLSGHIDVVPVDGQDWSQDPFSMWQRDGKLFGRGVVDMKGFVAVALALAPLMLRKDLKIPLHFAFSYDEEVGCVGVRGLIEDVSKNLPMPAAVIVGEPTSMQIIGGHKGSRSFHSTVRGVPAHSSDPRLGANSIMAAARLVTYLEELQQELVDNAAPDCLFDPPYTTIDLGKINGGTANNIIPEFTNVDWGMRILPGDDGPEIEQRVRDFIEREIEPGLKQVEAGMATVVFGPGSIEQAHQPDEFIEVSQIQACIDFGYQLIDWAAEDNPAALFE